MITVLSKAACFVAIIGLGFFLKKIGIFQEKDFRILSKLVLYITLPAAIIYNLSGKEIHVSLLTISLLAIGSGILQMVLAFFWSRKKGRDVQAFEMLNASAFNTGNYTMPIAQSFLGSTGVLITSLFDMGNAVLGLGGVYSIVSIVKEGRTGYALGKILKRLFSAVAFDAYLLMILLSFLHIQLPAFVLELTGMLSGANVFVAMFMLGVGFTLKIDRTKIGSMVRPLVVRYGLAVVLALIFYFVLPFPPEYRQVLVILPFSPVAMTAAPFTEQMNGDVGLSSSITSISIVISTICMVSIFAAMA